MGRKPSNRNAERTNTPENSTTTISEDAPRSASPAPAKPEDAGYRVNGREGAPEAQPSAGSVNLKLAEDGSALASTTDKTWRRLAEVIEKTPGAKARLLGGKSSAELIEAKQIEPFYSGIGLINAFLATRLLKLPAEVATVIVPYSQDELTLMSQATADAVNENLDKCPAWLWNLLRGGGSVAFAKLALVLFQVHAQKLAQIRQAMGTQSERVQAVQ